VWVKSLVVTVSFSSDPNMSFGDSLLKRGASIRRNLTFSNKKDKTGRQEAMGYVSEGPAEEGKEQKEEVEEEAEEEEMEEAYMLPDLPHTPLSGTSSSFSYQSVT